MYKHNIKNFIKCNCLHVRKWVCGLLAAQIILLPHYSFAQINPDITVQQMNNSFGVSAFDLTNYNLALNLNFGNKNPDTTYGALTAIYRGLAQAFGPAYYYEIQSNTLNSPARYYETQNVLRSLQAIEQNQWYMNQNLISSDNTLSNINSKLNTNNSLLTTQNSLLYDYNHVGDTSYSLGSTSKNTAVNTLNISNELTNIGWQNSTSQYIGVYDPNGNLLSNNTTYSYTDYYVGFTGFHNDRDSVTKINIPLSAWSSNPYVKSVSVYSGVGTGKVSELYYFVETSSSNGINVYFTPSMPYSAVYIRVTVNGNFHTISPSLNYIQYLPNTSEDYFKIYDFIIQFNMLQKDYTIDGNVSVDTTNLENKIDDVIDKIDDLSLTSNDVKLNLTINNNTGSDGTNIINRLQNFFNTGTSISDFFDNVDDAENGWFTQTNSDLINTLSGGYVDLYE